MTQDELVEKVERAIEAEFNSPGKSPHGWRDEARAAIRVVLEEAAKVVDANANVCSGIMAEVLSGNAAAIRALMPGEGDE